MFNRWLQRLFTLLIVAILITSNVLTLLSPVVNGVLSKALGAAFGIRTVHQLMQSRVATQREAVKRMGSRIVSRSQRMAARTLTSVPAKSIPFIGVVMVAGLTAWEITGLCQNIRDVQTLYADLDIDEEAELSIVGSVCQSGSTHNEDGP